MLITSPVRKAVPADEPELFDMCRELHKENAMFSMDEAKVRAMLHRAFDGSGAIIGAIGPTGKVEGCIFLVISSLWYSSDWALEELWSFVLPQYRKSNNAKDLVTFAKRCSTELAIPLIIGVVSNIRTQAKIGLYRRQLSEPCGAYFAYNMPDRGAPDESRQAGADRRKTA